MIPRRPRHRLQRCFAALPAAISLCLGHGAVGQTPAAQPPAVTPTPGSAPAPPTAVPATAAPATTTASPAAVDPNALPPAFEPSPIPLGNDLLVGGAVDLRTRSATTGRTGGVWVNSAELDFQRPITAQGTPRGNIVLQIIAEDPPDIPHGEDVQLGEAYLLYKLPIHTDTGTTSFVKVGQFQVPFALLAVYDPHLRLVQPLYAQSLGLRTDWGVALSGTLYGYLQYDFSLTDGSGPNHASVNASRLINFRLGRTFTTRNGVLTVGSSLLAGRLPVTDLTASEPFAVELPPSGRVRIDREDSDGDSYTSKTRIALDGTYTFRNVLVRGEGMVGADKDNRVQGYYIEGNYAFTRRATVVAAYSVFVYPVGDSSTARASTGLTYAFGPELSVSGLYEYLRDVPSDTAAQVRHRLTVQVLLRF
jgi:hypothetical protein